MSEPGQPETPDAPAPATFAVAFALAFAWALEVALSGPGLPLGSTLLTVLGTGALSLAVVGSLGASGKLGVPVRGALTVLLPVALFAAMLRDKTHHRALGGVTFAVVALGLVSGGALVARRLGGTRARSAAFVIAVLSLLLAVRPLGAALTRGSAADALVARDFVVFVVLAAAAVVGAKRRVPRAVARASRVAFWAAVLGGFSLAASSMPLRAMLSERAPFALGLGGLTGP
ncbi:MAG TPA: hypothetical protein VHE30_19210 [Polyangiaceae bacterium]|nr:hypothetical protein [Polyangiaceae bacterium]